MNCRECKIDMWFDKEVDNGNTLYHFTPEAIEVFKKR